MPYKGSEEIGEDDRGAGPSIRTVLLYVHTGVTAAGRLGAVWHCMSCAASLSASLAPHYHQAIVVVCA